jgi:hypothetical protein
MLVFYDKESEICMLTIDCDYSDITVEDNRAYYAGEVVNNNMAISAYAEVPKQPIFFGDAPRKFSELKTGIVKNTVESRLAALEAGQKTIADKVGVTLVSREIA